MKKQITKKKKKLFKKGPINPNFKPAKDGSKKPEKEERGFFGAIVEFFE